MQYNFHADVYMLQTNILGLIFVEYNIYKEV